MEIKIGIGLDNLIFGMTENETKKILGEPDKISDTEKENAIVHSFNDAMIKLKFDKDEDLKLYSIEVYNSEVTMFNQKIINKNKDEIRNILKQNGYSELIFEEYEFFETLFCEEIWTTFEFEFNKLRCIEFSPLFNNDEEIFWPNRNV